MSDRTKQTQSKGVSFQDDQGTSSPLASDAVSFLKETNSTRSVNKSDAPEDKATLNPGFLARQRSASALENPSPERKQ